MNRFFVCVMALVFTAGCAQLMEVQDKGAEHVGKAVIQYCEKTDEAAQALGLADASIYRENFRDNVNEHAAPHSVAVTCVPE